MKFATALARPACVLLVLGLALAACGGSVDRFTLKTPGSATGKATPFPTDTPTPSPVATPAAKLTPVTAAEKRVIRSWSEALAHGHVAKASSYFTVPAVVFADPSGPQELVSAADIQSFNRGLPCGAKLVAAVRSRLPGFIVGTFRLTERPGGQCGTGTGTKAWVAFHLQRRHIAEWVRVSSLRAGVDPLATGSTGSATPTPTPTPIPTPTPTVIGTPDPLTA